MMLLQAAHDAAQAAEAGGHEAAVFAPTLPWLILALPLLGFLLNGALAIAAARRKLAHVPPLGDPYWDAHHAAAPSEQEGHDHGTDPHPADHAHDDAHDDHGHAPAGPKPSTHTLPSLIAPGVMIAAFLLAVVNFFAMRGAHAFAAVDYWDWMVALDAPGGQGLSISFGLLLDPLSMVMTLIITGVGSLIHLFSVGYMKEDPGYPRYMAYLNLFVFFMLMLVLGSSYPVMFVGWEGVGLCSYLLIGFWFKDKANADAGKKAFIANRVGDFGFLLAMFLLFAQLGVLDFAGVAEAAPGKLTYGGATVTLICLFFFLGACGKSAQIPLFVWLPDAMAGPTPVSALIHAATMVTAGVYLVARSAVLFTLAPQASLVVALVGALTAIFAASIGLKQWDIKKILAYSTVSQLGFMFVGVGLGAYSAGVFHLMTHAFFKACLFLGSGAVIHAMHHALHATHNPADAQDVRNMGGLREKLPITFWTMALATLAIAGFPGFSGFFSKDEIIGAAWLGGAGSNAIGLSQASLLGIAGTTWMYLIGVVLTVAAFMTAFYMGRMMIYTFFGKNRTGEKEWQHLHDGDWTLMLPLVVLAFLSVVGGYLNVEKAVFDHVPVIGPLFNALAIGGDASLHHWLHPVLAGSEAVVRDNLTIAAPHHAAWPILLAILVGVGGLAAAWLLLAGKPLRDAAHEPAYSGGLEHLLYDKWWVDELYEWAILGPIRRMAGMLAWFDRMVVDAMVDFTGKMMEALGVLLGRSQTGQTNTYAFVIVLGVLAVLGTFVSRAF